MDKVLKNYHSIISKATLGSILIDNVGRVVAVNEAFARLVDIKPRTLKQAGSVYKYERFVEAGMSESFKNCIVKNRQIVSEHYYRGKGSSGIFIRVIIVPILSAGNEIAGAWALVDDISHFKKIELDLKASEEKYKSLVEATADGIMIIQDGVYKYLNGSAASMLGLGRQDLVGKQFVDYILPDYRDQIVSRYEVRIAGGDQPDNIVIRVITMRGELRFMELSSARIMYDDRPAVLLFMKDVSDWKIVQDKLDEEREKAQRYLDTAEVIILVLDEKGTVTLINRKGTQVLGYSEQEMLGKNWFDSFLPERMREKSRALFKSFISGEKPVPGNLTGSAIAAGEQEKSIFWYNAILRDETGRITGSIHSGTDITEQKEMQKELSMRAHLLDLATDSIYMLDEQGNFIYINENTWKTRGYERQELMRMNIRDIVAGEGKMKVGQRINEIFVRGEYIFESMHLCKDGSTFPVEIRSRTSMHNEKKCLVNIARDITDRKLADQVLSRSEERFRTILEEMDNGYFELDLHGQYIFANDAMCKILGLNRSDIISKHFSSFIDRGDVKFSEKIKTIINEVVNKGIAVSGLFGTIIKGDGTRRIIGISTSPMKDTGGKISGVRGITRDITDRMKMEQQLLIASKLASIGELAAGVAHEINNPLTAITGFAQLLMAEAALPEQVKKDLEKIYSQSQRAAKIVQNLLTFSRNYSLEKKIINVNDVILKTLDMRSYEHKVNNIDVITELMPGLPGISADENQIQQVILNIIVNAEQSIIAKNRTGIIKITTVIADSKIRIMIADNGSGIAEGLVDRIFDPFFTTKDVGSGTGLGLSVCHGIITKHGGTLNAESVEGSGATFIIQLPVASEEEIKAAEIPVVMQKPGEKSAVTRSVLVVDDEAVIRDILQRILSEKGYEVDSAESGAEGLEQMEKREYDIYLLDIKMPGINGKDLYEAINEHSPHLIDRVIFITGDTITRSTQDFLDSTSRIYLSKPFDFTRLIGSIEDCIKSRETGRII